MGQDPLAPSQPQPRAGGPEAQACGILIEDRLPAWSRKGGGGREDPGSASREPGNPEAPPNSGAAARSRDLVPAPSGAARRIETPALRSPCRQAPPASAPRPRRSPLATEPPAQDARKAARSAGPGVTDPHPHPPARPAAPPGPRDRAGGPATAPLTQLPRRPAPQAAAGAPTHLARARGCAAARPPPPPPQVFVSPRRAARRPGSWMAADAPRTRREHAGPPLPRAPHRPPHHPPPPPPGTWLGKRRRATGARAAGRKEDKDASCPAPPPEPSPGQAAGRPRGRAHLGPGPAGLISGTLAAARALEAATPQASGPGEHADPRARPRPARSGARGLVLRRRAGDGGSAAPAPAPRRRAAPWRFASVFVRRAGALATAPCSVLGGQWASSEKPSGIAAPERKRIGEGWSPRRSAGREPHSRSLLTAHHPRFWRLRAVCAWPAGPPHGLPQASPSVLKGEDPNPVHFQRLTHTQGVGDPPHSATTPWKPFCCAADAGVTSDPSPFHSVPGPTWSPEVLPGDLQGVPGSPEAWSFASCFLVFAGLGGCGGRNPEAEQKATEEGEV